VSHLEDPKSPASDEYFGQESPGARPLDSGDLAQVVLEELSKAEAFREIQCLRIAQDATEVKLADVCAAYLARFRHDQESRQTRDDLLARARGALANAHALSRGDILERDRLHRQAEGLKRAADEAASAAGLKRELQYLKSRPDGGLQVQTVRKRLSTSRAQRDGVLLDQLTVDLCVILRRATKMSIAGIVSTALPPVLEALSAAHPDLLPRRGLSDPETRFKRYMRRARKAYLSKGQTVTTMDLLDNRARLLWGGDRRSRPSPAVAAE